MHPSARWRDVFLPEISAEAPCLLIFAEEATARLAYTCRFVFGHVLGLNYRLITDPSAFETSDGWRINYSTRETLPGFRIQPSGLLSETGISLQKPERILKEGRLYLYSTPGQEGLGYDVFSAVFYLISRYEEWQPFIPDRHQRFEVGASILFGGDFHLRPVADIWIMELKAALQRTFPRLSFPEKRYRVVSTIDVDNLYAYRHKGLLRTLGAGMKDLFRRDPENLSRRWRVLSGREEDPFDIYTKVPDFCRERDIPLICFFLFRSGTTYDRTVDPRSGAFQEVFQRLVTGGSELGLHPSYTASEQPDRLREEARLLRQQAGAPLVFSRQHYLRFNIRTTPVELMEEGFEVDFTMGYASAAGFRAGTSHPFQYYNFQKEQADPLLFMPFCVMDGVYTVYQHTDPDAALKDMLRLAAEVEQVKGFFTTVFHERSFSDHLYKGFGTLYKKLHAEAKEIRGGEN
jgi:hypothetical protein